MSTNPALTIEQSVSPDGTLTLVCRGRITQETASRFRSEVKHLASQHKILVADLSAVRDLPCRKIRDKSCAPDLAC
jgi:hypothetical protein